MKYVRVIILNSFVAASALMGVAFTVLWVRSTHQRDSVVFVTASGNGYVAATVPHALTLGFVQDFRGLRADIDPVPNGWSLASETWGTRRTIHPNWNASPGGNPDVHIHDAYVTTINNPVLPAHRFAGFGWESRRTPRMRYLADPRLYVRVASLANGPTRLSRVCMAPFWFLVCVCLVVPMARARSWLRHSQRRRRGLCLVCGYDLQASTERCPECGTRIT